MNDKVKGFLSSKPYWLALNRFPGLGMQSLLKIKAECGKDIREWFNHQRPTATLSKCLHALNLDAQFDWDGVTRDLEWESASDDHHILTFPSKIYPNLLKQISTPPIVLFVKGEPQWLSLPQIAMVGSRTPSKEGLNQAFKFAGALSLAGLTVTSGLALGIDGASHEGALDAERGTIAVLAHGLDQCYPLKHRTLFEKITEQGALVSEYPIGAPPQRHHFPIRNRIISGLSGGVLVVEAAVKSGSLITARNALEQGRHVFALPGSMHNPLAKGCHYLIREGAELVESIHDVVAHLKPFYAKWSKAQSIDTI